MVHNSFKLEILNVFERLSLLSADGAVHLPFLLVFSVVCRVHCGTLDVRLREKSIWERGWWCVSLSLQARRREVESKLRLVVNFVGARVAAGVIKTDRCLRSTRCARRIKRAAP